MESKTNTSTFSRSCRPSGFRNLGQDQIEVLRNASLEIMVPTGMRFFNQEALDLFKKAEAGISDQNLVRIPSHLVEWARRSIPENVNIFNRNRQLSMMLSGDRTYYSVGSDCMSTYDLETGEHRTAVLSDVINGVRLVDALPNIDFVMSMFLPSDVPRADYERHQIMYAPITSAGAMALHNAAQLAGLVLSQLIREGSPLILSGRSDWFMDMRSMVSLYAASDAGFYGWDLARHYRMDTISTGSVIAFAMELFQRGDFDR